MKLTLNPSLYKLMACLPLVAISCFACTPEPTAQVREHAIVDAVFANGNIILEQEYLVTSLAEGFLHKAYVEEGDAIQANMPLFQLSNGVQSEQLIQAKASYQNAKEKTDPNAPERASILHQLAQAEAQLALDQKNHERYERLGASGAVAQQEADRARTQWEHSKEQVSIQEQALRELDQQLALNLVNAQTQLAIQQENNKDYFLSSQLDGQVLHVYKEPGELIRRGEVIAKVGGGSAKIKLYIGEEDINLIALGQEVMISLNTDAATLHSARVSKLYPAFDEQNQSFIAEASFLQMPPNLYINTQLQANIIIAQKEKALVIPSQFLSTGDSVTTREQQTRYVQVGIRSKEWTEVLGGLSKDDVLILPEQL